MNNSHSDALVFFGATGDLAYKKIFPSLQAMVKRGHLNVPVIGVAKAGWNLDQLRARAHDSLEKHGGVDRAGFRQALRSAALRGWRLQRSRDLSVASARSSAPRSGRRTTSPSRPSCSGRSSNSSANRAAPKARGSSSKSRSAQTWPRRGQLNAILLGTFPENGDLPHRSLPRQAAGAEHGVLPLRELVPGAVLESQPCRERADHDGGRLRRPGPRRLLRSDGRHPRRDPESSVPDSDQPGDGAAGQNRQRIDSRRKGQSPEGDPAARREGPSFAGSFAATGRRKGWRRIPRWRRSPRSGWTSIPGAGRAFPSTFAPGKCLPVTCTEVLVRLRKPPSVYPAGTLAPNHLRITDQS